MKQLKRINLNLKNHAPAGINLESEEIFFLFGYLASILFAISCFWARYNTELGYIYIMQGGKKLLSGQLMADFTDVLGISLYGFLVLSVCMIGFIFWHYIYHYTDSKSIYTMKMLPGRNELHRRCLTLPLAAMIISLATAFVMLVIFYELYITLTPEQCVVPNQWDKIWRIQ